MVSVYKPGDIVSANRAQATTLAINAAPLVDDTPYSVTLPINGVPLTFGVEASPPSTIAEVAALLLAELQNAQTVYGVALVDGVPGQLVVLGRRGLAFEVSSTANITRATVQTAVRVDTEDGSMMRDLIVISSENSFFAPGQREYYTRTVPGNEIVYKNRLEVRELDTGHRFEIDSAEILTVISRAAG